MAFPIRQLPRRVISFLGRKKDFVLHTQNNEKTGTQPRETFLERKKASRSLWKQTAEYTIKGDQTA
jgi:hypothetical protein